MVKAYLRYELADYFGALNTNRCEVYFDNKNKKILTGCGEYILIINIMKGTNKQNQFSLNFSEKQLKSLSNFY